MLHDFEIEDLFLQFSIPEEGRQLVRDARLHSPVRELTSHLGNSIVWFFSKKMGGKHLKLESRTVETPAATIYEDDSRIFEFWPQPFRIDLMINNENGKKVSRRQHIPDFLLIRRDGFYVHEWRDEARLIRLSMEGKQIFKDKAGRWHYQAAEDFFCKIGLCYELHSAFEHPRNYIQNIRFLEDYQAPNCKSIAEESRTALIKLFAERGSISFLELLHEYGFEADVIFKAIVNKIIAVDLFAELLHESSSLMVHRDMAIAHAYQILKNDEADPLPLPGMARLSVGAQLHFQDKIFEVLLVGGGNVLLQDKAGKCVSLPLKEVEALFCNSDIDVINVKASENTQPKTLADLSKRQIEVACERLDLITKGDCDKVSERTLQRWKEKVVGLESQLDKIIALADRNSKKGNRTPRLSEKVEALAEQTIRQFYNTPECRTAIATYRKYIELCDEQRFVPMSYPTFVKRVRVEGSIPDREGKRKAYQLSEIPLHLDYVDPIHGIRPHEVCYIDHTIMNIATVGPEGSALGKPALTLIRDGHTTQVRAFYLSYDPPSATAVLMTLRDYVRRNNRLPKVLVVDGGKEFRSKELAWFCRLYQIDLRHRPVGKPRGGSIVERAMGVIEQEFLSQLQGNTRIMKNVRMVTKSVNPFPRAIWTLTALHGALDEYLFQILENRIHSTLGSTPRDYEQMRILETGQREHVMVRFDQNLLLMTSPHTKQVFHTIDRIRGVWADNMYYWHDDFSKAKLKEKVEVRVEPWNAKVVYVYFRDHWIAAICRDLRAIAGRTRREIELAIRAERRSAKVNANKERLSRENARKMTGYWTPSKYDERIGKQQREMLHVYSRLGMTSAIPDVITSNKATEDVLKQNIVASDDIQQVNVSENQSFEQPKGLEEDSDSYNFWRNIDGYI